MIAATASPPHGQAGSALLWSAAAAVAIAAHAGAVAWALRQPPRPALDPEPAPAVLIDLEPAFVAPEAPLEQLTQDNLDAPEVETSPPEFAELVPEPPPPDLPLDPTPIPSEDALPAVEPPPDLPKPVERPEARPPERVVEKKPEPKKKPEPEPPSKAQARAQAVAPDTRQAAPANAAGASSSASPAKWQSRLMAHLERRKRYPAGARKRKEEGTVLVRFSIDGGGNVLSAGLARSSGHPELDEAVIALVRRASPVPPPPPGAPHDITAPVRFTIR